MHCQNQLTTKTTNIMSNIKMKISILTQSVSHQLCAFIVEEFNRYIPSTEIMPLLNLYNRFQEDERNGVDYLFSISSNEDVMTCLKGGMTINELHSLLDENEETSNTPLFFFGENHTTPRLISVDAFKEQLYTHAMELAECIVAYPWVKEYRYFYTKFVTNTIID